MARLKVLPQRSVTEDATTIITLTPPPASPSDDEAASQQLLQEVRASASKSLHASQPAPPQSLPSKLSQEPHSSAILGANLLNAARVEYRHSSPMRKASKPNNGRLSRAGILTGPRRQNLARPRQRDVYEIPAESPEKTSFQLNKKVNTKPLKIFSKKRVPGEHVVSSSEPVQAPSDGHASGESDPANEAPVPSSVTASDQTSGHDHETGIQIEERLRNGGFRCAVVSYRSGKPAGPRYEQCCNAGTHETAKGRRCTRHTKSAGSIRCGFMMNQDGGPAQCRAAGFNGTARCRKHAGQDTERASPHKRKADDDEELHAELPTATSVERHATTGRTRKVHNGSDADVAEPAEGTTLVSTMRDQRKRSKAHASNGDTETSRPSDQESSGDYQGSARSSLSHVSDENHDSSPEIDKQEDEEDVKEGKKEENLGEYEESGSMTNTSRALRRVFKFLDFEKRPGRCQTKLCLHIKRICDTTNRHIRENGVQEEESGEVVDKVQTALERVRKASDDRIAIKADMYGYVFRSLTKALQSIYECCDLKGDALVVMCMLIPLVRQTLLIKDVMAGWKVTVPQRYDGDRLIKDVDSHLIAPLREADAVLRRSRRQLENERHSAAYLADSKREMAANDEESEKQQKSNVAYQQRQAYWQQLHIARMQCEPDPSRRLPNLQLIKLQDLLDPEECDANGIPFRRVPIFKDRETRPRRHAQLLAELASWSEEQEEALLDGLQRFSGPHVLNKIFETYCHPCRAGGVLRDFNVLTIVDKAAQLRSMLLTLHEENGWDVPAWVTMIPVLL